MIIKEDNKKLSSKNYDISKIEEEVDKIKLKNKEKLNIENFSLKNKKENSIYYLRRRSKDPGNTTCSDFAYNKIISETKKNRIEKLNILKENKEEILDNLDIKNIKNKNDKFDRKKVFDKKNNTFNTTDNLAESNEFDKVISRIEMQLDKIQLDMTKDNKKTILKKFIENTKLENFNEIRESDKKISESNKKSNIFLENNKEIDLPSFTNDNLEKLKKYENQKIQPIEIKDQDRKIPQVEKIVVKTHVDKPKTKKHFFKLKNTSKDESFVFDQKIPDIKNYVTNKEVDESKHRRPFFKSEKLSDVKPVDLEDRVPKLEKAISVKDVNTSKKKRHFLNEKKLSEEKPFVIEQKIPDIKKDTSKKDIDASILKRHFFKIKNSSSIKSTVLDQEKPNIKSLMDKTNADTLKTKRQFFKRKKNSKFESRGLENKIPEIEKINIKPTFNVEKITFGDELEKDEEKLPDKKIQESQEKRKSDLKSKIKPFKLKKEHSKNKPTTTPLNKESNKKSDINLNIYNSSDGKESLQEHVFFDEGENPNYGWSSQIIEKEENKVSETTISQGEISLEEIGKVDDIELSRNVLPTKSVKLTDLGFLENEWEELDFYALHEPFAYVEILRQKDTLDKCYFLVEMALTKQEENILAFIKDTLINLSIETEEMDKKGEDEYLISILDGIISEYNIEISEESKKKVFYFISKSSLGLSKIGPLMKDPNIEDISCDGSGVPVFLYHRKYGSLKSNIKFEDEDELSSFIFKLAQKCGKHISIAEPMLDATMPDGSRIQMTLSNEITAKGSTFTIRKFRSDPFSPTDLIEFNTMSSEMIAYMWIAVENGINTLFAGGTASGKTTTLNAIMLFIPRESKIVSIEETRELNIPHPNWIPGVSRSGFGEIVADKAIGEIDTYDLMKAALRQRPEYIIVGEIRGKEAYVLFQAMATGHATYSTAHADSAQSLIHRLEGKPINIPRIMLQSLDLVCIHVITRVKNMRARRCKQIIEIIDIDPTTKEILTNEVFHWDPVEDKFIYSGKSYILERIRTEKDLTKEEMNQEISNRKKIIEWMNKNNIRGFKEVANLVSKYAETPDELLKHIGKDDNQKC